MSLFGFKQDENDKYESFVIWLSKTAKSLEYLQNTPKIEIYDEYRGSNDDVPDSYIVSGFIDKYLKRHGIKNIHSSIRNENRMSEDNKKLLEYVKSSFGNSVSENQSMLESDILKISDGYAMEVMKKSLIVSGRMGMGKSVSVLDILRKHNIPYGYTKGSHISSITDMYKVMYKNNYQIDEKGKWSGKKVIVFDDCPDLVRNSSKFIPILLSGLDDKLKRRIDVFDKKDPDFVSGKYPTSFWFSASMIFITNLPVSKINKAITDRSYIKMVNYNNKEVFLAIREGFSKFYIDVPLSKKEEVVSFMEDFEEVYVQVSFRDYVSALGEATVSDNWKEIVLKGILNNKHRV